MMKKRWIAVLVIVAVAGFAAALGARERESTEESVAPMQARDSDAASSGVAIPGAPPAGVTNDGSGGSGGDGGGGGAAGGAGERTAVDLAQAPDAGLPPIPEALPGSTRVIKNVNLEIEIGDGEFQRQFARASTIAEQFQGFVSGSQVSRSEEGELSSGLLSIRVPSDRFEQAVSRLKELGEVTGEDRSSQDVSREFVDLEARLRHAQTEEAFYLRLMEEAETVSDMIQVQSQLSSVQLRIEEIQGRLQYLRDQTSFSTITVSLFEPGASPLGEPKPLAEAWGEAVDGFQSVIAGAVVGLGWLAPFALAGVLGFGVWRITRRTKGKPASEPAM